LLEIRSYPVTVLVHGGQRRPLLRHVALLVQTLFVVATRAAALDKRGCRGAERVPSAVRSVETTGPWPDRSGTRDAVTGRLTWAGSSRRWRGRHAVSTLRDSRR
jgi:hypothetical protein